MDEGNIPDDWREANVTAIFKGGDKRKAETYWPISITSIPGKFMEKIIRNEIVEHMSQTNLLTEVQHSFINGKSCVTELLEFIKEITESIANGDEAERSKVTA